MLASTSHLRLRTATNAFLASRAFSTSHRASLARMQIVGRLAAMPELASTATGREMVRYSLATSYGPKDDRQTSWFRVAAFVEEGPRRNFLLGLEKGTLIYLEAEARMRTYEDERTGAKTSRLDLIHRNIEALSRPASRETESSAAEDPDSGVGRS